MMTTADPCDVPCDVITDWLETHNGLSEDQVRGR